MKATIALLTFVVCVAGLAAGEFPPGPMNWAPELAKLDPNRLDAAEKPLREMADRLKQSAVPTFEQAWQIAFESTHRRFGSPWREPYLFVTAVDVPGFAKTGDLVWEVRFERDLQTSIADLVKNSGLGGIVWVHAATKATKTLFP